VRHETSRRTRTILLSLALLVAATRTPAAQAPASIDGLWDAIVVANNVEIPFRFEIAAKGGAPQGSFFEGDKKIESTAGTFADGVLKLEYDYLNTTLELKLADNQLTGAYRNNRPNARPQEVRMERFAPIVLGNEEPPSLGGTWEMRRVAEEISAPRDTRTWNVFLRQSGAEFSGSILRVDGDTGTLEGHWRDGKLVLSHFAGERPNLFVATQNSDGTLAVTLNGNAHYLVVRKSEARAKGIPEPPDPSRYTNVKNPTEPFRFSFPNLEGKIVSNTDALFQGKVVVLTIGGSWCPNCHDEAPFLSELYRDYQARGLEIVGLMFENDPDPKVSIPRIRAFMKRHAVKYPMLLAGTTNPSPTTKTINEALPDIVNFGAYPTAIYLGRDGRVRSVHAGFASPATGEEHVRLKKELRALVEQLLSEAPPTKSSAGQ
jgi:thiol-disulfide isomerase/thioredoxin